MKAFLPLLTVLLWVLCFPSLETARADGIVISERALKPLEIPGQTGVILHRDGKETLTIWNKVQSDASPMAWVLPLPSVPEVIQETHPAAVRLLQLAAAPRMRFRGFGLGDLIFSGICLLLGVVFLVARRPPNPGK